MFRPSIQLDPGARVRRSPQFQVLAFSALSPAEQAGVRRMIAPDRVAVLRPLPGDWRRPQLVSAATAAALADLVTPRSWSRTAIPSAETAAQLILDGILELEHDRDFISGPAAHATLFQLQSITVPRHPLHRLSLAALRYAEALAATDPRIVTTRLYGYNRLPLTPGWKRRLGNPKAVERLLQHDRRRRPAQVRSTEIDTAGFGYAVWQVWDSTRPRPGKEAATFKLYLSPGMADVAAACAELRGMMNRPGGPFSVKAGRDLSALLRPDKLVGYFTTRADLDRTAARLRTQLKGMAGQGVPFTAPTGSGTLISWGIDPPADPSDPASRFERSWRAWITARLGTAIATAAAAPGAHSRMQYVMDRIALEGVDTSNWTMRTSRSHADH